MQALNYTHRVGTNNVLYLVDNSNELGGKSLTNSMEKVLVELKKVYGNLKSFDRIIYQDSYKHWDEVVIEYDNSAGISWGFKYLDKKGCELLGVEHVGDMIY